MADFKVLPTVNGVNVKLDNVSATDRLLGRVSGGAGAIEEILITDYIQGLLDDTDAATARGTLALGTIATEAETNYILVNGTRPLTGEWDIGEDMSIKLERMEARDNEGLRLEDDGGNLGVFIKDGGRVGIGTDQAAVTETFDWLTIEQSDATAVNMSIINTGAGQAALNLRRTGTTPSRWSIYIPSGNNSLRFYSDTLAADLVRMTATGLVILPSSSGKIGIGGSPTDLLHVFHSTFGGITIEHDNSGTESPFYALIKGSDSANVGLAGGTASFFNDAVAGDFIHRVTTGQSVRIGVDNGSGNARSKLAIDAFQTYIQPGNAAQHASVGGVSHLDLSGNSTTSGAEADLFTFTVLANTLNNNGQSLHFEALIQFGNNANGKQYGVRFGSSGTNLIGGALSALSTDANKLIHIEGCIIRVSNTSQIGFFTSKTSTGGFGIVNDATLNQTLSGNVNLRIVGDGAAAGDLTGLWAKVWFAGTI